MKIKIAVTLAFAICLPTFCLLRPSQLLSDVPAMSGPPGQHGPRPQAIPDSALRPKALKEVGLAYQKDVEPLLKQACFDCHSTSTVFPWYHKVPGVGWYLDSHVEEGKKRLNLSKGFPFEGRAPIVFRVRGIGREVKSGGMPLWDYKLMHPASRLTDEQKKVITDWAEDSFQKLSKTAKPYVVVAAPAGH